MKFISNRNLGWLVGSFVLSILLVAMQKHGPIAQLGFFAKTVCVVVGGVLGFAGYLIGDGLRRFTMPDAFFTEGGLGSILVIKLFWMLGPQLIGLVIGAWTGIYWMA
jgi:hypothetical protein